MFSVIRKYLILVLAILQLFVPLVHAHTGEKNLNHGLHVPGLELYGINHHAPFMQNVNADWNAEGFLVTVDAGIKNPQDMSVVKTGQSFAVLPSGQLQVCALPENDSNFSPQRQSFHFRRHLSTFSPRAPPAQ
jgi:hypothetical protein